jgi:hypothetical protein
MAKLSLAAYAAKHPRKKPGPSCWACHIPQRVEMEAAHQAGTPMTVIQRWLAEECGYGFDVATRNKLLNHFTYGKHNTYGK